jgi:hypothetical protein
MSGIKHLRPGINILIIPLIFLTAVSCNNTVCSDLGTTQAIIKFNDLTTRAAKPMIIDSVISPGTDSILVRMDTISSCSLPVNTSSDSSTYYFFRPGRIDTLVIVYTRVYSIVSEDCGYMVVYGNVKSGYNSFPEVISKNNELNQANESNIEIYY